MDLYSTGGIELDDVGAFHATPHPLQRALMQPVLRFFDVCQRAGVFLAGERTSLKAAQTISDDREQHFLRDAVRAALWDRAVLEQQD